MKNLVFALSAVLVIVAIAIACSSTGPKRMLASVGGAGSDSSEAYYSDNGDHVAPGDALAMAGRDVWIKATAGDSRFFAYVFPQRVSGKSINWPDMLLAEKKPVRFQEYGLINDPDCCSPAVPGECEAKFGRKISTNE